MCRRGDIFWAELGRDADGSLQAGGRPVLVISNDKANEYSPIITIIPITSKMNKAKLPPQIDCIEDIAKPAESPNDALQLLTAAISSYGSVSKIRVGAISSPV